uniref:DNA polymerase n=1 Tax=Moniliophthora roreri TaxID=221103 RepID=A0A0W0FVE5_MONRR
MSKRSPSTSDSESAPSRKRKRSVSPQSDSVRLYIVDAKLDPSDIHQLVSLVEDSHTQLDICICPQVEDADVIITAVRMRKRLERHLGWDLAKQKAIVTPQWLKDSITQNKFLPCGQYAALGELHDETEKHCPEDVCSNTEECTHTKHSSSPPPRHLSPSTTQITHRHRYACMRHSPLICHNQDLVNEFAVLYRHRDLEGWEIRALSYERTIAALKAYPRVITNENVDDVAKLPFIGEKALFKVKEYLRIGHIPEARTILTSQRYQSLTAFTSIHGIGPATARKLYSMNLRTLEDLDAYYDVHSPSTSTSTSKDFPLLTTQVALVLRNDLSQKIPREEVEAMRDIVMDELGKIKKGCVCTITGGYRRGKQESNDVDIVLTHPDLDSGKGEVKALAEKLLKRLYEQGLITHVTHLSSFRDPNKLRTSHRNSIEKALTVFRHGKSRRLDLIFAAPEAYWSTVVGWTGSKLFERDLRLWAKQEHGMKFDSEGITRLHDSKQFFPKSEYEVFRFLGLEWIDPEWRNADV